MKKVLIIGLVMAGFAFASASQSNAGVRVGIGIGATVAYPYGYYPYGYSPYGYHRYPRPYYRTVFHTGKRWYWHRGHRDYYGRPCIYRRY